MSEKELDKLKKDIEKKIDKSIDHSKDESFRESYGNKITKVQRPEEWPEPPDDDSED